MLFNSYVFVLAFLPLVYWISRWVAAAATPSWYLWWMVIASLCFYSWHEPWLGVLFVASITMNYLVAGQILNRSDSSRFVWLVVGIGMNLATIGYFKYLGFATSIARDLMGGTWLVSSVALPLGISFYTFQQVAYLIDVYRGDVKSHRFSEYALFVSFFPQLIAGPIVSHRDIVTQFSRRRSRRFHELDAAVGLTLFSIGLFKKVILADQLALYANPAFRLAAHEGQLSLLPAWLGMFSYALQLYFDFSGYSDMALGLGRMFGIKLPLNFDSPYKSVDIVDFWRRWHLTLSAFLRTYLYVPLGGSRCSPWRRSFNLLVTMLLGGLWHGAGWTFVLWGALHGALLVINHAWNDWQSARLPTLATSPLRLGIARPLTTIVIALTWVLFRADNCTVAGNFYQALFTPSFRPIDYKTWIEIRDACYWVPCCLLMVWFAPNSQEILGRFGPALRYRYRPRSTAYQAEGSPKSLTILTTNPCWQWRLTTWHATFAAALFLAALSSFSQVSPFIYFNF